MRAAVCIKEEELAIANYNAAYCRAKNAPEYLERASVRKAGFCEKHPTDDDNPPSVDGATSIHDIAARAVVNEAGAQKGEINDELTN